MRVAPRSPGSFGEVTAPALARGLTTEATLKSVPSNTDMTMGPVLRDRAGPPKANGALGRGMDASTGSIGPKGAGFTPQREKVGRDSDQKVRCITGWC